MPQEQHLSGTFGHNDLVTPTSTALADLRVDVKSIDPALLGRRIRHARQRAGLTQGDAAGTDMSTAYISRIEAGQRRPGADLLIALAERLHCTTEELLAPDDSLITYDAAVVARLTLELDFAELSLKTGSPDVALKGVEDVLAEAARTSAVPPEFAHQARLLRALALEANDNQDAAIEALEAVVSGDTDALRLLSAFTALSRCYREAGDFGRAADIGDRAAALVDRGQLEGTADGIRLAVTVAAAHYERGDTSHAVRVCQRAVQQSEQLDSPAARAAAYWNTSVMESRQGRIDAALPLAEKALALLEVAEDARSQTRLRIQLGLLHLRTSPPEPEQALALLIRAQTEGQVSDINAFDRARIQIGLARAHFLIGDLVEAATLIEVAALTCADASELLAVEALVLRGQVAAAQGRSDAAVACFREGSARLAEVEDEHGVGQLWFELGAFLDELGLYRESAAAYRSAGATTGLSRAPSAAPVPSS